jgi:hypothetical protein
MSRLGRSEGREAQFSPGNTLGHDLPSVLVVRERHGASRPLPVTQDQAFTSIYSMHTYTFGGPRFDES